MAKVKKYDLHDLSGSIWNNSDYDLVLCQTGQDLYQFICLADGNRWDDEQLKAKDVKYFEKYCENNYIKKTRLNIKMFNRKAFKVLYG